MNLVDRIVNKHIEKLAGSLTKVKDILRDKKYRDEESGRDISFTTAYGRGNEKAVADFKEINSKLKHEEKKPSEKKKITKKVDMGELPKLDEKSIKSIQSMDSWMNKKKQKQLNNIKAIQKEIEDIKSDSSISNNKKKKEIKKLNEKIKIENKVSYSALDRDGVEALGKLLRGTELTELLPKENFEDFMSSLVKRNSELGAEFKSMNSRDALDTIKSMKGEKIEKPKKEEEDEFGFGRSLDKDKVEEIVNKSDFKPVSDIVKEIKSLKGKTDKESEAKLGELTNQLAESLSIEYTLDNVILNPTAGLPKFKNTKMMTPKAMSKLYKDQQDRYGSLPAKERNIMMKKLEKKLESAQGVQKTILEKAMDAAVTDVFMSALEDPNSKENKLPKSRVVTDPKLMYLADKYGRNDFVEKAAELTRSTDANVHREVTSSMLHSLSDDQFKDVMGEDNPMFRPFLELLEPDFCPVHPQNERSGSNVDDDECPVRLTEKERYEIKQKVIDMYQDTTFFIAGGLNLEGYDDDTDVKTYNQRYDKVTKAQKEIKPTAKIKEKIKDVVEGITNKDLQDVMTEQEAKKLEAEMRKEITQEHIDKLGSVATGLAKLLSDRKNASNTQKIEWVQSAFATIPGFPALK